MGINLCGKFQFWDSSIWSSSYPEFSCCFQEIVFVWTPCLLLWLFAAIEVINLRFNWFNWFNHEARSDDGTSSNDGTTPRGKDKEKVVPRIATSRNESSLPWNLISRCKFGATLMLLSLSLCDLTFVVVRIASDGWNHFDGGNHHDLQGVQIYSPAIKSITFILLLYLQNLHLKHGIHTSAIIFLFWFFLSFSALSAFYVKLKRLIYVGPDQVYANPNSFVISTCVVNIPVIIAQLVLHCCSDYKYDKKLNKDDKTAIIFNPQERASFPSTIFFCWFNKLVIKGFKKPLTGQDVWPLSKENTTDFIFRKLERNLKKSDQKSLVKLDKYGEKSSKKNVVYPLIATFYPQLILAALLKLIPSCLAFVNPILLNLLIKFMNFGDFGINTEPYWHGILYAFLMLLSSSVESIFNTQYDYQIFTLGMRVKSVLVAQAYRKCLTISPDGRRAFTTGEILNIMSVDTQRVMEYVQIVNLLWICPLQIGLGMYLLWQHLHFASFAGLGVMILLLPINGFIGAQMRKLQIKLLRQRDKRIKLMNEILTGIKVLKLYAWEKAFFGLINACRDLEIKSLRAQAYLSGGITFAFNSAPFFVAIASFATYILIDSNNVLDAQKAFVSITIFNILRRPLAFFPQLITSTMMFLVSLKRINLYLNSDDLKRDQDDRSQVHDQDNDHKPGHNRYNNGFIPDEQQTFKNFSKFENYKYEIDLSNAYFSWEKTDNSTLYDISLKVAPGQLIAVVGSVGSGKSSLLSALLGEMYLLKGEQAAITRTIAYVPQQAWILNATVRENVVFGSKFDSKYYENVIDGCALRHDLSVLAGSSSTTSDGNQLMGNKAVKLDEKFEGDLTEIGEKGVNLSGGQKQRISLARAVYSNASIYLLDDPLSAVDSHVGKHIFDNVISSKEDSLLHDKTRIFVTHRVTVLPHVDQIVVMKDGRISEFGSYKELLGKKDGDFAEFLADFLVEDSDETLQVEVEEMEVIEEMVEHLGAEIIERRLTRMNSMRESVRSRRRTFSIRSTTESATESELDCLEVLMRVEEKKRISRIMIDDQNEEPEEDEINDEEDNQYQDQNQIQNHKNHLKAPNFYYENIEMQSGKNSHQEIENFNGKMNNNFDKIEQENKLKMRRCEKIGKKSPTRKENAPESNSGSKLTSAEKLETGSVTWKVYLDYIKAIGKIITCVTIVSYILSNCFNISTNFWLSQWSNDASITKCRNSHNETFTPISRNIRLAVYGALGLAQTFFILIATVTLNLACLNGSKALHWQMFYRVIHAPMAFFDVTPIGRILNRFSKDVDTTDVTLLISLRLVIIEFFRTCSTIVIIAIGTPAVLVAFLPLAIIYYLVQKLYISSSRQLRRIESASRSPIYSHFSETISGASSIRAYRVSDRFISTANQRLDENNKCYYASLISSRWLSIRLEFLGNLVVFSTALFAVIERGILTPGHAGLSISYAMTITATLSLLVRGTTELESNIVAVERMLEYMKLEQEADWHTSLDGGRRVSFAKNWPKNGEIGMCHYSTRYRPGLDLVINQLSINIPGGNRVGIVGRTGAGKSSLTLALFRLIESVEGTICIDGVAINTLGLHDLRSRLTIIPQEPILFTGTLRFNLDPFKVHPDDVLWKVLEKAHLKAYAKSLEKGLDHEITEGGDNMSVGQKQLVCLARALLKKSKILVLDEATAAVDLETDELIQRTIREEFIGCTILTIAHRLKTIMDYDLIMVMEGGKLGEYDSPEKLMSRHDSLFYALVKNEHGDDN